MNEIACRNILEKDNSLVLTFNSLQREGEYFIDVLRNGGTDRSPNLVFDSPVGRKRRFI